MGDEDRAHPQIMLSRWHHNDMSETRFTIESMQALMSMGVKIKMWQEGGYVFVVLDNGEMTGTASGWNFYAAFWAARDDLFFGRKSGSGNTAEGFNSPERQVVMEIEQAITDPAHAVSGGEF